MNNDNTLQADILPLSSSRRLSVLNAADNNINVMKSTADVIRGLPRLTSVSLHVCKPKRDFTKLEHI